MAALSNHVNILTSLNAVRVSQEGFGVPMYLSANAAWAERVRSYNTVAAVLVDFPATTGPEYRFAVAAFAQTPRPPTIMIGRSALKPTQVYTASLVDAVAGNVYGLTVAGDGVTETEISYTALADVAITGVTNGSDLFTSVAHGMTTGDGPYRLTNSGGGLPAGSAVDTNYWIIRLSADTFSIATSYANAIALTAINLTSDGTGTHTLQRDANDVITAILVDRLNSVVGNNYLAAQVAGGGDTDSFTVTADAAGEWFSIEVSSASRLAIAQTHADPGVATDLAAILVESTAWYALYTSYNSNLYVKAAAAWVEANKKLYAADVNETKAITVVAGAGTDTIDDLHTLSYTRTFANYHPSPAQMMGAAWFGRCLPIPAGSDNWKYKALSGIAAVELTATQRATLVAKAGNSVESVAGASITFEGTRADDGFIDQTRNIDFVDSEIGTRVFTMLAANDKIPYTDAGVSLVKAELAGAIKFCSTVPHEIFDPAQGYVITAPKVADVSSASRAARILPDVSWQAYEAGSINKVDPITGTVSL